MNIVNLIHIGEEVYNMDDLPEEKRLEIGMQLTERSLVGIGYKKNQSEENRIGA